MKMWHEKTGRNSLQFQIINLLFMYLYWIFPNSIIHVNGGIISSTNHGSSSATTPPRNISQSEMSVIEGKGGSRVEVTIRWLPPTQRFHNNTIKAYTLYQWSYNTKINKTHFIAAELSFIMPLSKPESIIVLLPNVTECEFRNLSLNRKYTFALYATLKNGNSPKAYFTISTSVPRYYGAVSLSTKWVYLVIALFLTIVALSGCCFSLIALQRRQIRNARNRYVQSIDEREHATALSMVPLNEDAANEYSNSRILNIRYDNLIMEEVIGFGAFGVVWRAKIDRKYSQVSRVDADGMQTVAVKMLKVSSVMLDDSNEHMKELVTMRNLGEHPQIVSLLGVCISGSKFGLVLEYCPEGDLLSFLHKVRNRYCPTLGLSYNNGSNSGNSWQSMEKRLKLLINTSAEVHMSGSSKVGATSITSSNWKGTNRSLDYQNNSTGSRSSTSARRYTDSLEQDEDCRPIDGEDILSYARQISTGMEYLEKNHVVHRDLACRNVLLLRNFRQVKISDFGLSRDIYYGNAYHQKSDRKLPVKWMAVESIFSHVFTTKSDIWSFGILLWELLTLGGTPYPGLDIAEILHRLKSGYRMERPDNCSEEMYALMKKCWITNPSSRPNFTELRLRFDTMLEETSSNSYLRLADLPTTDYFQLGSREDLLYSNLEDSGSPTKLLRTDFGTASTSAEDDVNTSKHKEEQNVRELNVDLLGKESSDGGVTSLRPALAFTLGGASDTKLAFRQAYY